MCEMILTNRISIFDMRKFTFITDSVFPFYFILPPCIETICITG